MRRVRPARRQECRCGYHISLSVRELRDSDGNLHGMAIELMKQGCRRTGLHRSYRDYPTVSRLAAMRHEQ